MRHILGNKVLQYDVDARGVIVDEREYDRTVNPIILADWVKEHMVFWYDMSKPVDVYTQNFNDWYNYNPNSVSITNNKIVVNGLIDNFRIASIGKETESFSVFIEGLGDKNLIYRVKLDENSDQITNIKLKDGENVLPHSFATTVAFMGVSGVTDYIGLTITQLPSGQSVPTNEILKANPYLQDFSGNNRPLKLNNFLFAAMSGVGGYDISRTNILPDRANVTVTDNRIIHITKKLSTTDNMVNIVPANSNPTHKFKVTGLSDGRQVSLVNRNGGFYTFDNGEHEVTLTYPEGTTSLYNSIGVTGDIGDMDVTIEFLPKYPNALITDGADDYGVVENFKSLQNYMMFFQCAITRPNAVNGMFSTTPIENGNNISGWMLLQGNYVNSVRFGNNGYKNFNVTSSIGDKISYVLSANNELMTCYVGEEKATQAGTYRQTGANMSLFLSDARGKTRFGSIAFYKSILFDSVPTKETDGFTEQDLINYVLENLITK